MPKVMFSNDRDNAIWWREKKDKYPFHATTPKGIVPPHKLDPAVYGDFIAVPIGAKSYWGFLTEEYRKKFIDRYNAKIHPDPSAQKKTT